MRSRILAACFTGSLADRHGQPSSDYLNDALAFRDLHERGVFDSRDNLDDRDDLPRWGFQYRGTRGDSPVQS